MTLPVDVVDAPCYAHPKPQYVDLKKVAEPNLFSVLNWDSIEAQRCEWRAPSQLRRDIPSLCKKAKCALRLVLVGERGPLKVIAAHAAFWDFDVALLILIAAMLKIRLDEAKTIIEILIRLIRVILGSTEAEALEIIKQRLVCSEEAPCAEEILNIEDARLCLQKGDQEKVTKTQEKINATRQVRQEFLTEFREHKRRLRLAAGAGKAKGKGKGAPPSAALSPGCKKLPLDFSKISQQDAKKYLPQVPKAYLWKDRSDQAWCARIPPLGDNVRSWRRYGEGVVLRLVISAVWRDFCDMEGYEHKECPMDGIDLVDPEAADQ